MKKNKRREIANPEVEFVSQLHHLSSGQAVELFMLVVEVLLERRVVDLRKGSQDKLNKKQLLID